MSGFFREIDAATGAESQLTPGEALHRAGRLRNAIRKELWTQYPTEARWLEKQFLGSRDAGSPLAVAVRPGATRRATVRLWSNTLEANPPKLQRVVESLAQQLDSGKSLAAVAP